MEKHIPKIETRYDDMAGAVSLNFNETMDFNAFSESVMGINLLQYEPVSLRIYLNHKDMVVTVFAIDKKFLITEPQNAGKIRVKKFKKEVAPEILFSYIRQIDLTLVNGDFDVESFEVVN